MKLSTSPRHGKAIVQQEYRTFMFRITPISDPDYETIKELHQRIEAYFRARPGLEKCVHRHMEMRGADNKGPLKHWLMLQFENSSLISFTYLFNYFAKFIYFIP